eukprot:1978897-Rhodomonas_salina.3
MRECAMALDVEGHDGEENEGDSCTRGVPERARNPELESKVRAEDEVDRPGPLVQEDTCVQVPMSAHTRQGCSSRLQPASVGQSLCSEPNIRVHETLRASGLLDWMVVGGMELTREEKGLDGVA